MGQRHPGRLQTPWPSFGRDQKSQISFLWRFQAPSEPQIEHIGSLCCALSAQCLVGPVTAGSICNRLSISAAAPQDRTCHRHASNMHAARVMMAVDYDYMYRGGVDLGSDPVLDRIGLRVASTGACCSLQQQCCRSLRGLRNKARAPSTAQASACLTPHLYCNQGWLSTFSCSSEFLAQCYAPLMLMAIVHSWAVLAVAHFGRMLGTWNSTAPTGAATYGPNQGRAFLVLAAALRGVP